MISQISRWSPLVLLLLMTNFLLTDPLQAAEENRQVGARFDATVDRTRASQSQPIRLTLTLASTISLNHVSAPELDLSDFDVFGPSVSTSLKAVNGRTTFSRVLEYTLYGRKVGRYHIGPATMDLGGTKVSTRPIDVDIIRRDQGGKQGSANKDDEQTIDDVLFVRATVEQDTAFVGQQIVVRFDLCYRFKLRDVGFAEIPTFTGFWVKELFVAQRLAPEREMIDGVAFDVAPLRRVALFPTSAGTHTIEPLAVSCSLPQGRNRSSLSNALSRLTDPIYGRNQNVIVRSEPLTIEALPLPQAGAPADFTGTVGRFVVSAEAQPRSLPVGDPITLRVEVEGDGNVQTIAELALSIDGFEVYAPTLELEEGQTPTGAYAARKKMEYILIPKEGGRRQIPSVAISYFDPEAAKYKTVSTLPFDIMVDAGEGHLNAPLTHDMTRREIEQLGRDIRHIKPDGADLGTARPLYGSALYWLFHGLLPVAYAGMLVYQRHSRRLEGDAAYARRRRARGAATERLSTALQFVEEGTGFHGALQEAVVVFIADQLNRPAPGLTRDVCRQLLAERELPQELVEGLDRLLERCDFGRFAPAGSGVAERKALLAEGEDLVERLRESLS